MEIPGRAGDDGEIAIQVGHDVEGGGNDEKAVLDYISSIDNPFSSN